MPQELIAILTFHTRFRGSIGPHFVYSVNISSEAKPVSPQITSNPLNLMTRGNSVYSVNILVEMDRQSDLALVARLVEMDRQSDLALVARLVQMVLQSDVATVARIAMMMDDFCLQCKLFEIGHRHPDSSFDSIAVREPLGRTGIFCLHCKQNGLIRQPFRSTVCWMSCRYPIGRLPHGGPAVPRESPTSISDTGAYA